MPSAREVLQFVLTADAASAIRGFEEVEASATASLGAAETSVAKFNASATKLGAGGLIVGGLLLVGLGKTAQLASEAQINLDKLTTAAAHSNQHIDVTAIQNLNKELQKSTEFRADTMFGGQALFVNMGLTTDQIKTLTPLVADLAARFGVSFDMAAKLTVKAVDGTASAFKRLTGLNIQSLDGQVGGFANTVQFLSDTAGGFAEKQGATFAGQLVILKNNLHSLGADVGQGAADALSTVVGGLSSMASALDSVSPKILSTGGEFATYGALALVAVSATTLLVGQVSKATIALSALGGALVTAEGELTAFGIAASTLGLGAVAIGILNIGKQVNDATQNLHGFKDAKKSLDVSDTTKATGAAFKAMAQDTRGGLDKVDDFVFGVNSVKFDGFNVSVAGATEAVKRMVTDHDFVGLQKVLPELKKSLGDTKFGGFGALAVGSGGDLREQIAAGEKLIATQHASTDAQGAAAGASKQTTAEMKAQAAATKQLETDIKSMQTPLDTWASSMGVLAAGGKAAAQAIDFSTMADDQIANASKMGKAVDDFKTNVKSLPGSIDQTKLAMGGYSDAQQKAIDSLSALAKENQDYVSGLIASGSSTDDVKAKAAALNGEFGNMLKAAGLTTAQIQDYQHTLGLTPDQVTTAIKLSGDAEAKAQLTILSSLIDGLSAKDQQAIAVRVSTGDSQAALQLLLIDQANLAAGFTDPYIVKLKASADTAEAHGDLDREANILRVANIFAQADVAQANGDLNGAAAQRRTAAILAQALGLPVTQAQLDGLANPGGKPRQAGLFAHVDPASLGATQKQLDDLTQGRTVKINATVVYPANFMGPIPPGAVRAQSVVPPSTAPAPPALAPSPHALVATLPPGTPSTGITYVDQRRITTTIHNPAATVDTLKGLKRALKANGEEMRRMIG